MRIGKREQIVIGVISAIVLIAVLHITLFAKRQREYREAKQQWDQARQQLLGLRRVPVQKLQLFDQQTTQLLQDLASGIDTLALEDPDAYYPPPLAVALEYEVDAPEGASQDVINSLKYTKWLGIVAEHEARQVDLILEEIGKLVAWAQARGVQNTFIGPNGWKLPTQLPNNLQRPQVLDMLRALAEIKGTLDSLREESPSKESYRQRYEFRLQQLGLNLQEARQLSIFGELVPLIHKIALVKLVLEKIELERGETLQMLQRDWTRDDIFELLETKLPRESVIKHPEVPESELYFAFQQVRQLNMLLEMADELEINNVSRVEFRAFGYLRKQTEFKAPAMDVVSPDFILNTEDEVDIDFTAEQQAQATPTPRAQPGAGIPGLPGMPGGFPGSLGGMKSGAASFFRQAAQAKSALPATPTDDEFGFALPIRMTFRATNMKSWSYIYEVLQRYPLAECRRIIVESLSQPKPPYYLSQDTKDLQLTATFLMIPKIFKAVDQVQGLLEELGAEEEGGEQQAQAGQPQQPPAGQPAPPPQPAGGAPAPGANTR